MTLAKMARAKLAAPNCPRPTFVSANCQKSVAQISNFFNQLKIEILKPQQPDTEKKKFIVDYLKRQNFPN